MTYPLPRSISPNLFDSIITQLPTSPISKQLCFIDVRTIQEYNKLRIPLTLLEASENSKYLHLPVYSASKMTRGLTPAPSEKFEQVISTMFPNVEDVQFVIGCSSGVRSKTACARLGKIGYKVCNLEGGIMAWDEGKLPLEFPEMMEAMREEDVAQ